MRSWQHSSGVIVTASQVSKTIEKQRWQPENKSGERVIEQLRLFQNRHKPMYDITPIPGQSITSYGRDDYAEYGSALQAETEFQVPDLDFTPNTSLEQSAINS